MKHTKRDGYYSAASSIIHTVRPQVRIGLRTRTAVPTQLPVDQIEKFNCIHCHAPHNVFETNIRGRILRGYVVTVRGRTKIQDGPGTPVKPCYFNGRLCGACYAHYAVQSNAPTDYKSIQLLKDFSRTPHQADVITPGMIATEDALQEIALQSLEDDKAPKHGRLTIRVEKAVSRHLDEPIDANCFRRFMQSRGGGVKDYHANPVRRFDAEVNYQNQKRSKA